MQTVFKFSVRSFFVLMPYSVLMCIGSTLHAHPFQIAPMIKKSTAPTVKSAPMNCSDFSGKWAGECAITIDGQDQRVVTVDTEIFQEDCKTIQIGPSRYNFHGIHAETRTSPENGSIINTTLHVDWVGGPKKSSIVMTTTGSYKSLQEEPLNYHTKMSGETLVRIKDGTLITHTVESETTKHPGSSRPPREGRYEAHCTYLKKRLFND